MSATLATVAMMALAASEPPASATPCERARAEAGGKVVVVSTGNAAERASVPFIERLMALCVDVTSPAFRPDDVRAYANDKNARYLIEVDLRSLHESIEDYPRSDTRKMLNVVFRVKARLTHLESGRAAVFAATDSTTGASSFDVALAHFVDTKNSAAVRVATDVAGFLAAPERSAAASLCAHAKAARAVVRVDPAIAQSEVARELVACLPSAQDAPERYALDATGALTRAGEAAPLARVALPATASPAASEQLALGVLEPLLDDIDAAPARAAARKARCALLQAKVSRVALLVATKDEKPLADALAAQCVTTLVITKAVRGELPKTRIPYLAEASNAKDGSITLSMVQPFHAIATIEARAPADRAEAIAAALAADVTAAAGAK